MMNALAQDFQISLNSGRLTFFDAKYHWSWITACLGMYKKQFFAHIFSEAKREEIIKFTWIFLRSDIYLF